MSEAIYGGEHAKRVVQRVREMTRSQGKKFAEQWGEPIRGEPISRQQQVDLWRFQNPQTDPLVLQQLLAAGQTSQALDYSYPYRNALIGKGDVRTRVARAQQLAEMAMQVPGEML